MPFHQVTTPPEDRRDDMKLYHKMSLAELTNKAPFVSAHSTRAVFWNSVRRALSSQLSLQCLTSRIVFTPGAYQGFLVRGTCRNSILKFFCNVKEGPTCSPPLRHLFVVPTVRGRSWRIVFTASRLAHQVDWHRYANHLMSKRSTPLELPPSERIVVYAPEFLANISALIRDMLRTDEGKK